MRTGLLENVQYCVIINQPTLHLSTAILFAKSLQAENYKIYCKSLGTCNSLTSAIIIKCSDYFTIIYEVVAVVIKVMFGPPIFLPTLLYHL